MTPPISKDWWLAAALSTATVPAATLAQNPAGAAPGSGVVTAVAPGGQVTGNNEVMVVGSSIVPGQRLRTNATGVLHVLFLDQSALTLGPDSELSIDEFSFDPASRQGRIRLGLAKGTLRVVGGQLSKHTGTLITTPGGSVEILGGITIVNYTPPLPNFSGNQTPALNAPNIPGLSTAFMFGQSLRATPDPNGGTTPNDVTITRPGFGTTIAAGPGQAAAEPARLPIQAISGALNRLESQPNTGSAAARQPGGAPPGQLLSTANNPGGTNNPGGLSSDRLKNLIDTVENANPSNNLRDLLTAGPSSIQS